MLLIHRFTPFLLAFLIAASVGAISLYPTTSSWLLPLLFILVAFWFARLTRFRLREKETVILLSTPLLFVGSALLFLLFVESESLLRLIGLAVAALTFFYAEHLFRFLHVPAVYQAYGLQNLTGVLNVLSLFFFAGGTYAMLLLVRVPMVVMAMLFFVFVFVLTITALWIAKIPRERTQLYALSAAVLFTELFVAVSYLPARFMTNAAILAVLFYLFLGLSRALMQAKLTRTVVMRYVGIGSVMLGAIILSGRWV